MNSRLLWTWGHKLEGNGYLVIVGMQGCRRFPRIVNERRLHVWLRSNGKPQTTSQILECLSPYRHTMWFRSPQFIRDSNIHHMNWYRVLYKYDFAFLWFGGITFHWPSGFCTNPGDLKPLIWLYSYVVRFDWDFRKSSNVLEFPQDPPTPRRRRQHHRFGRQKSSKIVIEGVFDFLHPSLPTLQPASPSCTQVQKSIAKASWNSECTELMGTKFVGKKECKLWFGWEAGWCLKSFLPLVVLQALLPLMTSII